jgi:putative glutamine amidotransferase
MRPIIGITTGFDVAPHVSPRSERLTLLAPYTDAVYAAGGLPWPLPPPPSLDEKVLDELLGGVDGVLFTGGPDIDPRHFAQTPHRETHVMHERRGAFDLALFRRADAGRVPILAICLGHQIAHVARGGSLHQHVDDLRLRPAVVHHQSDGGACHPVRVDPESRLARIVGGPQIEVNSRHHQIVNAAHAGHGLRATAFSPDGVLEASEDCAGRFLVTVQWHPENLTDRPEHMRLFEALVDAARESCHGARGDPRARAAGT